ncbi:phosphoserine aminotransferase-like protein [Dermatophagoides farinae]|uniref:phosphoserine transaminase n=1 Tax=Dermatophagoides farinae TaxID=6954 RepID=A0A9D4NYB2_DERFA|nr:phosphoserine aminotransferase-like protein [Dermatophagoides farinae]
MAEKMKKISNHVINCNAGPARVPYDVLRKAQEELIYYENTGISVMEMSHRSPEFDNIIRTAEKLLREIMTIPDNYRVLFVHGGGTAQFASIPLNLCPEYKGCKVNYAITGTWSEKAAKEAEKYCHVCRVTPKLDKFTSIPDVDTWKIDPDGKYLFYTDNETIAGVEYQYQVKPFSDTMPVAIDMTSNFLSRPIDVSNYGVIIAGTQKNAGIAGLAIVIVRDDLLDQGGLEVMGDRSDQRARLIYDTVDQSNGFYYNGVNPNCRSRMNAVFRIGGQKGDEQLEKQFIQECKERKIIGVKGHRLVGGIRVSMFNAMPVEDAKFISDFMIEFMELNRK